MLEIPVYRNGEVVAHALIDDVDADQAQHRWGTTPGCNYVRRRAGAVIVYLHREILGLVPGDGLEVDHRNRDRFDCRRENLRVVTRVENSQNVPGRPGTSAHRGVAWDKARQRWRAQVMIAGRQHQLGRFDTEDEAAAAAAAYRREHMPFSEEREAA